MRLVEQGVIARLTRTQDRAMKEGSVVCLQVLKNFVSLPFLQELDDANKRIHELEQHLKQQQVQNVTCMQ